tara:strand:+ start:203 stop:574 length:372 start_codon:yes stop_codon:yes gene_type:complete
MYNYSVLLTYRDSPHDDQYREELLEVFGIHSGPCPYDELTPKIEELYTIVAEEFEDVLDYTEQQLHPFLRLQQHEPLVDKKSCFMLLFSWEHFYETHRYLGEILSKGMHIEQEKQALLEHIKK